MLTDARSRLLLTGANSRSIPACCLQAQAPVGARSLTPSLLTRSNTKRHCNYSQTVAFARAISNVHESECLAAVHARQYTLTVDTPQQQMHTLPDCRCRLGSSMCGSLGRALTHLQLTCTHAPFPQQLTTAIAHDLNRQAPYAHNVATCTNTVRITGHVTCRHQEAYDVPNRSASSLFEVGEGWVTRGLCPRWTAPRSLDSGL